MIAIRSISILKHSKVAVHKKNHVRFDPKCKNFNTINKFAIIVTIILICNMIAELVIALNNPFSRVHPADCELILIPTKIHIILTTR